MCPIINIFGVRISSFLLFNAFGFIAGAALFGFRLRRASLPRVNFWQVVILISIGGYVGTKLYYIFEEPRLFFQQPLQVFFSLSGSGWFGGFLTCLVLLYIYLRRRGVSMLRFLDVLAPAIPLGIIFGRFACFLAGDGCYGIPTDLPWGMSFPNGVLPTLLTVHPTQLYEMAANGLILFVLLKMEKNTREHGVLFGSYLIMGGIVRFLVEFIRLNPIVLWGLTAPQFISVFLFLWGLAILNRHRIARFLPGYSHIQR